MINNYNFNLKIKFWNSKMKNNLKIRTMQLISLLQIAMVLVCFLLDEFAEGKSRGSRSRSSYRSSSRSSYRRSYGGSYYRYGGYYYYYSGHGGGSDIGGIIVLGVVFGLVAFFICMAICCGGCRNIHFDGSYSSEGSYSVHEETVIVEEKHDSAPTGPPQGQYPSYG